jgi:two-component system phosphate regulon sensor histidine kinase PhoR
MSKRKKLLWQLFPTYLLTTIPALIAIALFATSEIRNRLVDEIAADLQGRAVLMRSLVVERGKFAESGRVQEICERMGRLTSTRYTLILTSGRVVGDSDKDPESMDNHAGRPEIRTALGGATGRSIRHSATLERDMLYVAVPIERDGDVIGVVRASVPVTDIDATVGRITRQIFLAGVIVALLSALVSLFVAHRMGQPLRDMRTGAARFADGDLGFRLEVPGSEEMASLAEAMNKMAAQLDERIRTVTRQRNELQAVLSSMIEAVLVVDPHGRVVRSNRAARSMFSLAEEVEEEERTIRETIHNADLNRFVRRILDGEAPLSGEILLHRDQESHLLAHGTNLVDDSGTPIGALVVLNDVTELKKLERIRSDFVANVSHELRTPITSIKGFVETLKDGALDDRDNADRFLEIIDRHVERLDAIIEDLLSLSRIEQESESGQIALRESAICEVVGGALTVVRRKADEKGVTISQRCPEDLHAEANAPLLEQAVVNLVDNAVKFSEEGSEVLVQSGIRDDEVVIEVTDTGPGIPREHQDRIFERFYRVDRARSRKAGGTGLGLAIVKHIAVAHGGRVSVQSRSGQGSTFRIHLPLRRRTRDGDQPEKAVE